MVLLGDMFPVRGEIFPLGESCIPLGEIKLPPLGDNMVGASECDRCERPLLEEDVSELLLEEFFSLPKFDGLFTMMATASLILLLWLIGLTMGGEEGDTFEVAAGNNMGEEDGGNWLLGVSEEAELGVDGVRFRFLNCCVPT